MYKKVDSKLLQIGNNVREYRKQKHYNQEKLAELLDVSVATVSRIENGSSAMDILILMNISKILEQPIDNIISLEKDQMSGIISKIYYNVENLHICYGK